MSQPQFEAFQYQSMFRRMVRDPRTRRHFSGADNEPHAASLAEIALTHGEPYFVAGPICDLIADAAAKLTFPWTLSREFVPAPQGFMWFSRPVSKLMLDPEGREHLNIRSPRQSVVDQGWELPLRGFAWTIYRYRGLRPSSNPKVEIAELDVPLEGGGDMNAADGIFVQFFNSVGGGQYLPVGFTMWRYGRNHLDLAKIELGMLGEDLPADQAEQNQRAFEFGGQDNAAVAVTFQLIHQRILRLSPGDALDRTGRKQAKREGWEHVPLIRTVLLRSVDYKGYQPPQDETGIHRTVQWYVHGFWRNQFYPSLDIHQPRYVTPHWRGDPNAPIKPPDLLYHFKR